MQLFLSKAKGFGQESRTLRKLFRAETEHLGTWNTVLTVMEPQYPKLGGPGGPPYPFTRKRRFTKRR